MIIAKLALFTSGVYMLIAILLDAGLLVLTHRKGGIFYAINYRAWAIGFGIFWLISFSVAWKIVITPLKARFR